MPIAGEEYDRAAPGAKLETARNRPAQGRADEISRALADRRTDRNRPKGSPEAEDTFQLDGAAGLAAGLAIATAFWSVLLVILHVWVP